MSERPLDIVISGGGTGGHVYPALAVADQLRNSGARVRFIGTAHGPEARLAPMHGLDFEAIASSGFDRSRPISLLRGIAANIASAWKLSRAFKRERPDAIVGFGGYVAIPVGLAARMRKIPLVVHEQNSVPGLTNTLLSRWAEAVAVTYPDSAGGFAHPDRVVVTGNPVRDEVLSADRDASRRGLGISEGETLLVVFGGSSGARRINSGVITAADDILAVEGVRVVHVTGAGEYDAVVEAAAAAGVPLDRWELHAYRDDLPALLSAADLIVSRAGATSIAEITVLGAPSVLVPYPHATADHQTKNAEALANVGATVVVSDDEVEAPGFADTVVTLLRDPLRRDTMSAASGALGRADAAARVARLVLDAATANPTTLDERGST